MEETIIKGLMSSTWAEEKRVTSMSKDTGNILAVKILPSVFMFWKNIHTITSGNPLGSGMLSMCGNGARIHL